MVFQSPGAVALDIGPLSVHWYGILIAVGFVIAIFLGKHVAKEKGENPEDFMDLATIVLVSAIIGARIYYVIFNWSDYSSDLLDIFKVWHGGLAIHGGIIGGLIAGIAFTKYKKLSFAKYCDITSLGLILGQAIGRWGNFFNSEAFGTPTDLPWKLFIPSTNRPPDYIDVEYFHPTFLYESLWNFGIFFILYFGLRKRLDKYNGTLFLSYLALYSFGRFFIEGLRTDSLMLFNAFRTAQVVSIILIIASIAGIILIIKYTKTEEKPAEDDEDQRRRRYFSEQDQQDRQMIDNNTKKITEKAESEKKKDYIDAEFNVDDNE